MTRYTGTDFSGSVIKRLQSNIAKNAEKYPETILQQLFAHEIDEVGSIDIDTIIVNSVVQYFPGEQYLSSVLEKSIHLVKDKGQIILGDIRDFRLLKSFKARLQMDKLQDSTSLKEFEWRVDQLVMNEEELCVSPVYFVNLKNHFPEIHAVTIEWKSGDYLNELSLYRYTATIHLGSNHDSIHPEWIFWDETAKENYQELIAGSQDIIAIKGIPNPRLWKEEQIHRGFKNRSIRTLKHLSDFTSIQDDHSHWVTSWLKMASDQQYIVRFLVHEDPYKMDVVLSKTELPAIISQENIKKADPIAGIVTNMPLFPDICMLLQDELAMNMNQLLPEYMVPTSFTALPYVPLTLNGKVDSELLILLDDLKQRNAANYLPPRTETEKTLVNIWQELLKIDRIGVNDNFFELGGHSLLAMRVIAYLKKEFDMNLSIRTLFQLKDLGELAVFLDALQETPSQEGAEYDVFDL